MLWNNKTYWMKIAHFWISKKIFICIDYIKCLIRKYFMTRDLGRNSICFKYIFTIQL